MMDSSGSGHGAVATRAAPHQVAAFKARLAAASRPDAKAPSPKGRWAALPPGALAVRPAAAARLATIESAGSEDLNATGPRQMAHDTSSSSSLRQQETSSSTASHLRDVATEEGLNTTESSGFDTSGASFLGPLGIGPFESSGEGVPAPPKQRTFSETGEVSPARKTRMPPPPARRDCPAMTLERSTIFGFRETDEKYSMRKYGSCSSFDRQSFDHSGHSLFGVESVASDGDPIKDEDGVRPAPSASNASTIPESQLVPESPSPKALPEPRPQSRVIAAAAVGAACAAEFALRWGAGAYPRDVALRASGALWCLAALAAARTL